MHSRVLLVAAFALSVGAGGLAAAQTKPAVAAKGVKCGDSYIAAGRTCTKAPLKPAGKGVPCGDSFIAVGQVCHKPAVAAAKPAAITAMKGPAKPMEAKPAAKGKKCGDSYIAANAVCTKK